MPIWILFQVPCPTPNGISADQLLQKRIDWISPAMQASARKYGEVAIVLEGDIGLVPNP
jgi:hypothetical protein